VGPRASLDRCGKFCPTRIPFPDRPAHSESLPWPTMRILLQYKILGSHSSVGEHSGLLECYTMLTGRELTDVLNNSGTIMYRVKQAKK